jgi:hypothetical protein
MVKVPGDVRLYQERVASLNSKKNAIEPYAGGAKLPASIWIE